jgi:hypothetical protein
MPKPSTGTPWNTPPSQISRIRRTNGASRKPSTQLVTTARKLNLNIDTIATPLLSSGKTDIEVESSAVFARDFVGVAVTHEGVVAAVSFCADGIVVVDVLHEAPGRLGLG